MFRKKNKAISGTVITPEPEGANYAPKREAHREQSLMFTRVLLSIDWNTWVMLLAAASVEEDLDKLEELVYASEVFFEHVQKGTGLQCVRQVKSDPVAMVARIDFLDFFRLNYYAHYTDDYFSADDSKMAYYKEGIYSWDDETGSGTSDVRNEKTPIHELGNLLIPKEQQRLPTGEVIDLDTTDQSDYRVRRPKAPEKLSDSKLDKTNNVKPIFEGSLNRVSMAEALKIVREKTGLSIRGAADAADVDKKDIQRVEAGEATLDKSKDILLELGYDLQVQLVPIDNS